MDWTDEQKEALKPQNSNILLSAAAGSGKTTVLVERVLRLIINEGADVDHMLVVTFTRAAASDMRAKLSKKLNDLAAQGNSRCREQLLRLERASISTMHAFCADFLRTHFESAGVDPAFKILDDAVNARFRDEAITEALEEAYAQPDNADLMALDYGRGPGNVRSALEILFNRLEERPDPEKWIKRATDSSDAALSEWFDEIKASALRTVRLAMVQMQEALQVPNCPMSYEKAIKADLENLHKILEFTEYDDILRALNDFTPTRASGGRRGEADPVTTREVQNLRDGAKKALSDVRIKDMPILTARKDAQALSGQIATLAQLAFRAKALYEARKDAQAGLTYADLEHKTLHALQKPEVAAAVRDQFDYIFIDEYQDTSDLQEALIGAICRRDNVFMVGDVKQSIYRFRLAEPKLFLKKYADYRQGHGGKLLPLTRNYRSRPGILNFVNRIFERVMQGGDAEIQYDALARLNPGITDMEDDSAEHPLAEIHLIDSAAPEMPVETDKAAEALAEIKAIEREGLLIAQRIRAMMTEDPTLKFRDFAILTRSKSAPFSAMLPMMLSCGIPAYADGAAGYYDSIEITWMLAMLRLIANRRSDVELISMLYSPVVGLNADQLADIRIHARNVPYFDAVMAYTQKDNATAQTLRDFLNRLDSWQLKSSSLAMGEFVRLVLDESGFYVYAGTLPGGGQRQANLDQFVTIACNFDREISGSLTRFLQYTEHLRQKGDGDVAHLLSENDDVVRMMTIHKSKGLEFRVVFGAQLSHSYRTEKSNAPLVAHRDLGIGMNYIDPELRTRRMTLPQLAIMERQKREDAAEEMRILYVLLTRARERLVLTGHVRNAERAMKRWQAIASIPFAANSHLDLIMAARCSALNDGLPCYSTVEIHPASQLTPDADHPRQSPGRNWFDQITAHPEKYLDAQLDQQMRWQYPDPLSARKPLKLTVSGLLRELQGPEQVQPLLERPAFLSENPNRMTGAERGTAYHRAMQLMNIEALKGLSGRSLADEIRRQLDTCANRHLLSDAQRAVVRPTAIGAFFSSDVGQRLLNAGEIHREWPFNAILQAGDVLTEEEAGQFGGEALLVQGSIDCCFMEDGQWVLLDYKTDRADNPEAVRAHYQKQLRVYALALERITGIPVRQKMLCLIAANAVLEV